MWSFVAGDRATEKEGSTRVRVYERRDRDGLFLTRAWVTTPSGRPVEQPLPRGMGREEATKLARLTAAERQKDLIVQRPKVGEAERTVTLGELLEAYASSEVAGRWRPRTAEGMQVNRQFWLRELGDRTDVMALSPSLVESTAQRAARASGWSPRTEGKRIAFLRAAVRWAYRRRRMIPRNPLDGVEVPSYNSDTSALIYSEAEVRKLVTSHREVDWRVTLAASIAYDTGRRITAITHLRTEDLVLDGARLHLHFRADWDKRKMAAMVPVSQETALLLAEAVDRTEVEEEGWLFPGGRLEQVDEIRGPISRWAIGDALHRAEATLGIPRVQGRAFHGIKRRHVTTSMEISHGDTALVGDVTGNVSAELLRRVYRQQNRARVTAQVDRIREALSAPDSDEDTPEDTPLISGVADDV